MSIATSQTVIRNHVVTFKHYSKDYLDKVGQEVSRWGYSQPTFILMRGISGSGKSCVANSILDANPCSRPILKASADDYFIGEDGEYRFDGRLIGEAHNNCMEAFEAGLSYGTDVILDNTNVKREHMLPYIVAAYDAGYYVQIVELTPPLYLPEGFEDRNLHGTPRQALERQLYSWERVDTLLLEMVSVYHILPIQ